MVKSSKPFLSSEKGIIQSSMSVFIKKDKPCFTMILIFIEKPSESTQCGEHSRPC